MATSFYQDNHIRIYNKDCRSMSELPDESVQCVVTSPPYWSLRKYSGEQDLIWGGDKDCEHEWGTASVRPAHPDRSTGDYDSKGSGIFVDRIARGEQPAKAARGQAIDSGSFCSICGDWKGQLGLEPTPELYLQHLIEIMQEIKRVLRKDGVFFLNIGDSYWGGKGTKGSSKARRTADERGYVQSGGTLMCDTRPSDGRHPTIKPKDLCLIPARIQIAAQEDGWWVRSVIIWSKPNPMPESVKDRPAKSHEYILMLMKSGTTQYWTHPRKRGSRTKPKPDYVWIHKLTGLTVDYQPVSDRLVKRGEEVVKFWSIFWTRRNLWQGHDYYWDQEAVREPAVRPGDIQTFGGKKGRVVEFDPDDPNYRGGSEQWGRTIQSGLSGRNLRTVWTFPTQPYPEAHFAVFPEKLPELCIKAATPEVGCCSKCGAPWTRIIKKGFTDHDGATRTPYPEGSSAKRLALLRQAARERGAEYQNVSKTIGWQPTCKCNAQKVPSLVLDPLMGSGTTLLVAKKLNRYAAGYELSQAYCQLAVELCRQQVIL